MTSLPTLPAHDDREAVEAWVEQHLGDLTPDAEVVGSRRFRGGQTAADGAVALLDVTGYKRERNQVWPEEDRGATMLSPWIRHGLLPLPRVWRAVADAPRADREKFRDELLWQEYARHWYARLGTETREPTRNRPPAVPGGDGDPWDRAMRCMEEPLDELDHDGWLVNQVRMWLASQWTVRHGADWRDGEDLFFRALLDGSRAANRLGWQWTTGAGSHKQYGFSRWQVEKRAPGFCEECALASDCPIDDWPEDRDLTSVRRPPGLRSDADVEGTAGPVDPVVEGDPEVVWLTAESLGDEDPALEAHPDLPVVFVFDEPLLRALRLRSTRLVFLTECLADLASRRELEVLRGDPAEALAGRALATTFAPVPKARRLRAGLEVAALHPWPWLARPHGRSIQSFSAWRKHAEVVG